MIHIDLIFINTLTEYLKWLISTHARKQKVFICSTTTNQSIAVETSKFIMLPAPYAIN